MSLVEVRDLRIVLDDSEVIVVDDVSFDIDTGEVVGLVGESGSGKTTIGNALLGHARRGCHIAGGSVVVAGVDVGGLDENQLQAFRGATVAYIPQDPTAALNPAVRIGRQVREMLAAHDPACAADERERRVREALDDVGLPDDPEFLRRFPHQLSGGQQQRVAIAIAFILRPRLVVMDEPTTGLDVTTQQVILSTVRRLCEEHRVAALYVTHDLSVVANLAHRVMVAYAGRLVETAERTSLFGSPRHPYTQRLLLSVPDVNERRVIEPIGGRAPDLASRGEGCAFAQRCEHVRPECTTGPVTLTAVAPRHEVRCARVHAISPPAPHCLDTQEAAPPRDPVLTVRGLDARHGQRQVLFGIDLTLGEQECLALVGESGSGKTTLSRALVGLVRTWEGEVAYRGTPLSAGTRGRDVEVRRNLQYVFQSPYNALNPRRTVGDSVGLGAQLFFGHRGRELSRVVGEALEQVSLPAGYADRYPDQLSGGERQRAAIARALACQPTVLICDEITSALDVSVQASIVQLLGELQVETGLSLLFVTHNLALVRSIADRVMVLKEGRVVEHGDVGAVMDAPADGYTKLLLEDTLSIESAAVEIAELTGP